MSRKMVMLPVLALLMLTVFAPALVEAAVKVPVTATLSGFSVLPGPDSTYWVTDGGVVQIRNWIGAAVVNVHVDSLPAKDYVMQFSAITSGTVNHEKDIAFPGPWPEAKGIWTEEITWSYKVGSDVLGTFEGIWNLKSVGWYLTPGPHNGPSEGHAVLHGTGIFDGMTLNLDSAGPPAVFTGYALMH